MVNKKIKRFLIGDIENEVVTEQSELQIEDRSWSVQLTGNLEVLENLWDNSIINEGIEEFEFITVDEIHYIGEAFIESITGNQVYKLIGTGPIKVKESF